ncbi:hypothetical protein [Flavobacterium sp.]|uniref:hypothetical protein n=1 Tax=Flavobacterium sp. TaxID=239 RepID=UPI0037516497
MNTILKNNRIEVVDALRGFAIMCIVLLHNMEHFEFVYAPPQFPEWLKTVDQNVMFSAYFLFGGKAYAIFALLFGFSFIFKTTIKIRKEAILDYVFYGVCFYYLYLDLSIPLSTKEIF